MLKPLYLKGSEHETNRTPNYKSHFLLLCFWWRGYLSWDQIVDALLRRDRHDGSVFDFEGLSVDV